LLFIASALGAQEFPVLQPLGDRAVRQADGSFYVPLMLDSVRWGYSPNAKTAPAVTVPSGSVVTFDVVSHEGVLEDQGRDPVRFFGRYGVPRNQVLLDAIAIAASKIPHDFAHDGPHVISAAVAVEGARPGDVLKIEMIRFTPRVPYGVTSIRHGKGNLREFPEGPNNESFFIPIRQERGAWYGLFRAHNGREMRVPLRPFLGTMGVAVNTNDPVPTAPPGAHGGNLDLPEMTVGATLYLPVQVPGALFYVSDSHFAQGNGEVDLTAIEGSLRATVRLTALKAGDAALPFRGRLAGPFAETPQHWIPIGLDVDLNAAMRKTVRNAIDFLTGRFGLTDTEAYAYLSIGANFAVSEVVDVTQSIHALIRKSDFEGK
jgi:acetamidase/formamidase